jgi:hypothetical protein
MRQSIDYDFEYEVNDEEAELAVKIAHNFVDLVIEYLKKYPLN